RDTADPRELGALRPSAVADAEVEVPRPGVDRHVAVEHRHLRRRREPDLVRGALDERADGDRRPVFGEELSEKTLDAVALDVHLVIGGDGPVELADDHGESIRSLEREHHRQADAQRPGRHVRWKGLRGQAPDRLHRGVVQDGVGGGVGDRDGADRPVGPDDDLDVYRAAQPAPASPASAAGDACWGADASAGADVAERAGSAGDSAPVSLEATGSAAGGGSALLGGVEGTGAERAATIGRSARALPRRAGPAAGENAGPAALECPRSVRSMNSVPTSVSPLTASSTASTRPAWRAREV